MTKKEKKQGAKQEGIFDALDSFMAMPLFDISRDESDNDDETTTSDSMSFDFLPDDDGDEVNSNERAKSVRPFHDGKAKAKPKNKEATGDNESGGDDGTD